jgi:hypothetical protein
VRLLYWSDTEFVTYITARCANDIITFVSALFAYLRCICRSPALSLCQQSPRLHTHIQYMYTVYVRRTDPIQRRARTDLFSSPVHPFSCSPVLLFVSPCKEYTVEEEEQTEAEAEAEGPGENRRQGRETRARTERRRNASSRAEFEFFFD